MLNYIWIFLFLGAFFSSIYQALFNGNTDVFNKMVSSMFSMSKVGFEISIGLTGVMAFWLGMMKIAEAGGMVQILTRVFGPILKRLFPGVPSDHPAIASMVLNFSANMLGLDNAATPLGLKAMKQLQELNPDKKTATNAQIMFLVINTSAVTIIPVSIFTYLYELGHPNPTEVFIPILLATSCSTLVGVTVTCLIHRINLIKSGIIWILGTCFALLTALIYGLKQLDPQVMNSYSSIFSNFFILTIIATFVAFAFSKRVNVYENFIEGAKEGFQTAITIIPYLIAMLVAIGIFRASGAMDILLSGFKAFFSLFLAEDKLEFIHAIPTALMKPLSGSGARGLMVETIKTHGVDSIVSKIVSVIQGSTETTFYVLAVYFGSIGITRTRHAALCGLLADFAGIISAIFICYFFFA